MYAKPTIQNGKQRWDFPVGTIIVKEVYQTPKPAPGEQPVQLTIMVKAPNDPHSQGGWLWITDGNPDEEFSDYVYFVPGERNASGQ